MNYFKDCECQETAKDKYRSLAKKLHPDMGGSSEEMVELTKQYEEFKKYGPSTNAHENVYQQAFNQSYHNPIYGQKGGSNFNPHIKNALNQAQYWKKKFEDIKYQHDDLLRKYNLHVLSGGLSASQRKYYESEITSLENQLKEQKKKATKLRKEIKMLKSNLKT